VSAGNAIAIGANASASVNDSVALGSGAATSAAVATTDVVINGVSYAFAGGSPLGTVSVGAAGFERTLTNVAAGRLGADSTDAVNGSQLFATNQAIEAIGQQLAGLQPGTAVSALAGYTHGTYGSPLYGDGGSGSTALGIEASATGVEDAVALGEHAVVSAEGGTAVGQGATVAAAGSVALGQGSVADRAGTVSVGSAGNERQVTNVAAGTQATDAVNKGQLDRGVASANSYTDARAQALSDRIDLLQGGIDDRFRRQDDHIDRQGAMGAAMLNMAVSAAGVRTPNRVGVGMGFQGGESALSVGYQRAISERATVTVGGAFSDGESSIGLGAGFGW
jgi:autotransporter adhesin